MTLPTAVDWWRPDALGGQNPQTATNATPTLTTNESPVAFWALMTFLFILLISPQSIFPVLAPLRPALLAGMLAIFAHIASRFKYNRPVMEFTRETVLVICIVIWAILTVPFSMWPGGSISYLLDFYLKTLMGFWLLANLVNTLPRLQAMAWGLCLMSVPLALTGVKNYLGGVYFEGGGGRVDGYTAPLTGNPNDMALMLNLLLPLSITLFLSNKRPVIRMIVAMIIGLNVLAVFMTFSRGGFLTLAVIVLAYCWMLRKRPERRWAFLVLFLALVMTPFAPSNYIDRINTITNIEDDETGSAQTRWSDMIIATKYVLKHPLTGAGLGMNQLAMNKERGAFVTAIHNVYLQYAVELGLPGLLLFLMLFKSCIRNVSLVRQRFIQADRYTELFYLAEGIQISLIAFVVAAFFYPVGFHFYFYIIAGIAVAVKSICDAGERSRSNDSIPS